MRRQGRQGLIMIAAAGVFAAPAAAAAATYNYVDWMAADVAHGTASGTITLPDASTVAVTFAATTPAGAQGTLYGAQVDGGGINYWLPSVPYISTQVENAPPSTDILQLAGGMNQTYTVTLSEPIKDPIMAIVSLGAPGLTITYNFDSPFTIVSQGIGYWGGSSTALVQLPNNVLQGTEGHGTIQFIGTFSTFSWTVPTSESWHGFTFGIRTTQRLEPPDGGIDGGGGAGGGGVGGGAGGVGGGGGMAGASGGTGGMAGASGGTGGTAGAAGIGGGSGSGGASGAGGVGGSAGAGGVGGSAGAGGVGGGAGAAGVGGGAGTGGSIGGGGGKGGSTGGNGGAGAGGGGGSGGVAADGGVVDGGNDGGRVSRGSSGCGCGLVSGSPGPGGVLAGMVVGLGLMVRRRRRRRDD